MGNRTKDINDHIGSQIKKLRLATNLTQEELGTILNKKGATVRMWELKKSEPDNETINKLADFFDVTTDFLLGRVNTQWSSEERAQGITNTINKKITPQEDILLSTFREIGQKKGASAQDLAQKLLEQILNN